MSEKINSQTIKIISQYNSADLFLLRAITMLHPGVGRGGELVDLPVQRDGLNLPIIYGSSIKGALKSAIWRVDKKMAVKLFGSEPWEGATESFTSVVAVLDAYLVAIPARSLEGVYAFLTSPLMLRRLENYVQIVNTLTQRRLDKMQKLIEDILKDVTRIKEKDDKKRRALVSNTNVLSLPIGEGNQALINEELLLSLEVSQQLGILEKELGLEVGRLVLLCDDAASYAVDRSLIKVTRVRLKREMKKVERGGLWDEEHIPEQTIFCVALLYSQLKDNEELKGQNTETIIHNLLENFGYYLVIGGNETVGRGIIKFERVGGKTEL